MSTTPARHRALVIGEALTDIVRTSGRAGEHPGGSPMNVSFGLGRLGEDVTFLTRIGDDERGRAIIEHLNSAGVVVRPEPVAGSRTSTAEATIEESGSAQYVFDIEWTLDGDVAGEDFDVVHFGSIGAFMAPGAAEVRRIIAARHPHLTVTFDPNVRPALLGAREEVVREVEELVALSDVVKASDEDLAWLYPGEDADAVALRWLECGASLVFVTRGSGGSIARSRKVRVELASHEVEVVDTIGAGDAFMAGILSALGEERLLGKESKDRLRDINADALSRIAERATACAALTVARAGAQPPWLIDLEKFPVV